MRKFLDRLFGCLRRRRPIILPLAVKEPDEWTTDDAKTWTTFLKSETGLKLQGIMYYDVYQNALTNQERNPFQHGIDAGRSELIGNLMGLSEVDYYRRFEESDGEE